MLTRRSKFRLACVLGCDVSCTLARQIQTAPERRHFFETLACGELGINVAGRAEYRASDIAALGSTWARCVLYPDTQIQGWIQGCHDRGVRVLGILGSESIGTDPAGWVGKIDHYATLYLDLIDAWQVGNEPDGTGESSWTMTPWSFSALLKEARGVLGSRSYLVAAGMVSGQPGWLKDVDLSPVNAIACHPYAKWPGTDDLDYMLEGYAGYGKPLWVTEYHARTIGMAAALRDDPRLTVAMAFCYSDQMVDGFGLIESKPALADYLAATGIIVAPPKPPVPTPPPAEPLPIYQLGFLDFYNAAPTLLGQPIENERGGIPGLSFQGTDHCELTAAYISHPEDPQDKPGWHYTALERSTRYRYELRGSTVVRIA